MSENIIPENIIPESAHPNPPPRFDAFLIFAKLLITVMVMFPLAHYSIYGGEQVQVEEHQKEIINATVTLQETIPAPNATKKIQMRIILPPSCPPSDVQETLSQLCRDVTFKAASCTPEDFENQEKHKIPVSSARHNAPSDPRTNIVSYVTVGFILVSLTAAFLELYKAKKQAPAKSKAPLTRKCSLADLTIMKHQRKELVRRDSILEGPDAGKQPGRMMSRPTFRLD